MTGLSLPLGALGTGLMLALAILLGSFALLAWRVTILLKLGTREIARRRARAALIVFGLTLSTTVIAGALGTGDTMGYSVRALVSQSLGPVDEVVTLNPPRTGTRDQARALVNGGLSGLSTAGLGLFDQATAGTALAAARGNGSVAGVTPAIVDQVSVVDPAKRETQSGLLLMAVPAPYPSGFGALSTAAGTAVSLAGLPAGDVVLNQPAAVLLGAAAGRALQVQTRGVTWDVRVAAVAAGDALGGAQPTVIAPLASYQLAIGAAGQVNAVLVANRGGADSVLLSDAATQALRVALANRDAVRQIHDYLAQPEAQRALLAAESGLSATDRGQVEALRVEAARPQTTDRFAGMVTDPTVRRQLFSLARAVPTGGRGAIFGALRGASSLSVFAVKQSTLDQANQVGSVVTAVFLVLGIFSIFAAALLVFLVFSLLGADRAAALATMRALGMTRRQVMGVFLFEGLSYDLAGAAIGAVAGVGAALLTTWLLGRSLATYGLHLALHVEPRSILVAFAAGVLLTFAAMVAAAWRVSRAEIVAATRGSLVDERRDWFALPGGLLILAAGIVWHRWRIPPGFYEPRNPLVVPVALSLALLGLACWTLAVAAVLERGGSWRSARRAEIVGDALVTLLIVGVVAVWVRALSALPTPFGDTRSDAVTVAVSGVVLIVTATATIARMLGPLLGLLDRALASAARLRAVVRPAAGEMTRQRWRSGMAVVMFGMVIFTVVAGLTLIDALATAYGGTEPPIAGFQLRADQSGSQPISDMVAALDGTRTVALGAFSAVGGVTPLDVQIVQIGVPDSGWHGSTLAVLDDGFLQGIQARIDRPASGYDTASAWAAVRDHPGTAVVSASLLGGMVLAPGLGSRSAQDPLTIWARPSVGGQPVKLSVIGIIDGGSSLDPAIYTSGRTAQALAVVLPPPSYFLFALRPGQQEGSVAAGLRLAFTHRGLSVSSLDDRFQIVQSVRGLLTQVVQGFMSLGLVAGIAALGMLAIQSVIERRAQLGTLRALGFTRWQTRATLALESTAIALSGIAIGLVLGLALAHSLLALLAQSSPEVRFVVPWSDIALTAGVAWVGSTLAAATGVWQAGRVSPAEALRAI